MNAVQFADHGDRGVVDDGSYPDPAVAPGVSCGLCRDDEYAEDDDG